MEEIIFKLNEISAQNVYYEQTIPQIKTSLDSFIETTNKKMAQIDD